MSRMRGNGARSARGITVSAAALMIGPLLLVTGCSAGTASQQTAAAGPSSGPAVPAATASVTAPTSATAPSAPGTRSSSTSARPSHASVGAAAQSVKLPAAQLPSVSGQAWQPAGAATTHTVTGHDIEVNECASVDGATTWTQQGYASTGNQDPAVQDTFTFTSHAAAQAAYSALVTGMRGCQQTSRSLQSASGVQPDAVVAQTAAVSGASAWKRAWTGVQGVSAAGPQTDHLYLAVAGSAVLSLQFTEFPSAAKPYDDGGDSQVLAELLSEPAE